MTVMTRPATRSFAVVPAAGRSVRMGRPKLLLPWGPTTILEQVLAIWRSANVTRTIVVAHRDDHQLANVARCSGADVVVPDVAPPQMKDSVVAALKFIDANFHPVSSDVWLLAPADVPKMSPQVIARLLEEHDADQPAILVPCHHDRRGHPVLLPWPFAALVHALNDNQGINALVEAGPTRFLELGPEAVPNDIDTPEDLQTN
jgi:molybdenum cofactor cytidylyltransferase